MPLTGQLGTPDSQLGKSLELGLGGAHVLPDGQSARDIGTLQFGAADIGAIRFASLRSNLSALVRYAVTCDLPAASPIVITDCLAVSNATLFLELPDDFSLSVITPSDIRCRPMAVSDGEWALMVESEIECEPAMARFVLLPVITSSILQILESLGGKLNCSAGTGDTPERSARPKRYAH